MQVETTIGCRALSVPDPVQGSSIPTWVFYPAEGRAKPELFGPYEIEVAMDAPLLGPSPGEALPLVVVSHGNGGTPFTHRLTAAHLVQNGFVVVFLEHPGNSRSDNRLAFTAKNLANRPRHVRVVLDSVLSQDAFAAKVDAHGIAVLGHSIGAYTALALAGGKPTSFPNEEPDLQAHAVPVEKDERIARLVLLAPASAWYREQGALREVNLPILMRTGERDLVTPAWQAEIILKGVFAPEKIDHRVVQGAGHFSFQSPFPPAMVNADFPPSQDPPGFDRASYQPILNEEILAFLRR